MAAGVPAPAGGAPNPEDVLKIKCNDLAQYMLNPAQFREAIQRITEMDKWSRLEHIAEYDRALEEQDPVEKGRRIVGVVQALATRLNLPMGELRAPIDGWTVPANAKAEDQLKFYNNLGETRFDQLYNRRRR